MYVYSNMLNCISSKIISKGHKSEKKGFYASKFINLSQK